MIKFKNTLLLFGFACLSINTSAEQISQTEAQKIALQFLNTNKNVSLASAKQQTRSTATPNYYVFNVENNEGFVIVTADDKAQKIVAYSNTGNIDIDNAPEALKTYLASVSNYVDEVKMNSRSVKANTTDDATTIVAPLCEAQWNQLAPFNNMTPIVGSNQSPTGCVPTALTQIMKYHAFPSNGKGRATYINTSNNLAIDTDLSQSTYLWDKMLNTYTDASAEENKNAVALLMRDVGYASEAQYESLNTSSATYRALKALAENFSYSKSSMVYRLRFGYTDRQWLDMIEKELREGRPVFYTGTSTTGGQHAIVCDGYDSNDFLHINWGWGGMSNGFYDINVMRPNDVGTGANLGNFTNDQSVIIGIKPSDGNEMRPNQMIYLLNNVLYPTGVTLRRTSSFSITVQLVNYDYQAWQGKVFTALYRGDDFLCTLGEISPSIDSFHEGNGSLIINTSIPAEYADGDYNIRIISQQNGFSDYMNVMPGLSTVNVSSIPVQLTSNRINLNTGTGGVTSINGVETSKAIVSSKFIGLDGAETKSPKGIVVRQNKYNDGTIENEKIYINK